MPSVPGLSFAFTETDTRKKKTTRTALTAELEHPLIRTSLKLFLSIFGFYPLRQQQTFLPFC